MGTELTPTMPITLTRLDSGDAPPDLSPTQVTALEGLLAGKTAADAAAAAGVAGTTIYKWLRNDLAFQAALNRGRRDLQQAVSFRIDQLAADAAACVARAVREGDAKTAMEILKRLDVLTPRKIGSDDELDLDMERKNREEDRANERSWPGFIASCCRPWGNNPNG